MSATLCRLRSLLQDELFIRGPHGLQPMPRAFDLAEPVIRMPAEIQRALESTRGSAAAAATSLHRPEEPSAFRRERNLGPSQFRVA
jgi:DNA-binding transcriptional LysR family regulator